MIFRTLAKSAAAVLVLASSGFAATSWTPSSGSTANYTYSDGQTEEERFTDSSPTVVEDSFLFFPTGFEANDDEQTTIDSLQFVVTAKPGKSLGRISAGLTGDWSLLGDATVNAFGKLTITNAANTSETFSYSLTFTPSLPSSAEDGVFSGVISNVQFPTDWASAIIRLDAGVGVDVDEGSTALIQLKGADVTLQAAAVPLPGALAALPFAAGVAWVIRRKRILG
ncbi:MAG TPA: hypothetical protein VGB55_11240 [Tepidisphaeraceae bacterium]